MSKRHARQAQVVHGPTSVVQTPTQQAPSSVAPPLAHEATDILVIELPDVPPAAQVPTVPLQVTGVAPSVLARQDTVGVVDVPGAGVTPGGMPTKRPASEVIIEAVEELCGDVSADVLGVQAKLMGEIARLHKCLVQADERVARLETSVGEVLRSVKLVATQAASERERLHEAYLELATAPLSTVTLSDDACDRIAGRLAKGMHVQLQPNPTQQGQTDGRPVTATTVTQGAADALTTPIPPPPTTAQIESARRALAAELAKPAPPAVPVASVPAPVVVPAPVLGVSDVKVHRVQKGNGDVTVRVTCKRAAHGITGHPMRSLGDGVTYQCGGCGRRVQVTRDIPPTATTGLSVKQTASVLSPVDADMAAPHTSRAERRTEANARDEKTLALTDPRAAGALGGPAPWTIVGYVADRGDGTHTPTVCIGHLAPLAGQPTIACTQDVALLKGYRCPVCKKAHDLAKASRKG